MTDRELLELAAKTAEIDWFDEPAALEGRGLHMKSGPFWNPLTDDGDALRLAATLKMNVDICDSCAEVAIFVNDGCGVATVECYSGDNDPYAATRRAIVRAAAEIGKGLE